MQKVIVNIDNPTNANLFLKMVEQLNFVESVKIEDKGYDWINPTRHATDEECEQMIKEAEESPSMTSEDAKKYSLKLKLPDHGKRDYSKTFSRSDVAEIALDAGRYSILMFTDQELEQVEKLIKRFFNLEENEREDVLKEALHYPVYGY